VSAPEPPEQYLLTCLNSVAHYMVGGVQENDVIQDIKDAKAIGLDGFALNYGMPSLCSPLSF
jgi:hypothetical protein